MLVEIDEDTIDTIMAERIKQNITDFREMISNMDETGEFDGVFADNFEDDRASIVKMLESALEFYRWYEVA